MKWQNISPETIESVGMNNPANPIIPAIYEGHTHSPENGVSGVSYVFYRPIWRMIW